MSIYFAGNTRLPMVAGWDRLLPRGLRVCIQNTRRRSTQFLFVGAVTLVLGLLSLTGVARAGSVSIDRQCGRSFLRADLSGSVCDTVVWDEGSWRQSAMVAEDRLRVRLSCYCDLYLFLDRSDY